MPRAVAYALRNQALALWSEEGRDRGKLAFVPTFISRARTFSRVSIQCDRSPWVCKASASRILMNHRFINEASIHSQTKRGPSEGAAVSLRAILICFMMCQA